MPSLTFLGTGTSQGVPIIACHCAVCQSSDSRDTRLRSSVAIDIEGLSLVIDTGPDFRQQMLRDKRDRVDAILYTHGHKDHTAGMDDIRAYNYIQKKPMPLYLDSLTEESIKAEFAYIFSGDNYPGIPQVFLHHIEPLETIHIEGVEILPIPALHANLPVLGFRIGNLTYITDANYISSESMSAMQGTEVLILNALRQEKHLSHFTLAEAIEVSEAVQARQTYLTHISHQMGKHADVEKNLPSGVSLAYDTLSVDFSV